jgi:fibro-slime domain-containing protein
MKRIYILFLILAFPLLLSAETNEKNTITLTGTLRDFNQDHVDFEPHVDWENDLYQGQYKFFDGVEGGLATGLVLPTLNSDRKPVANNNSTYNFKPKKLYEWYHDVDGVNMSMPYAIELVELEEGSGVYQFSSDAFFPADGKLFGKENYHGENGEEYQHNFHMTYELHTKFTYKKGQVFNFVGDDDVWVFIDNKLAVDLGGLHEPKSGSVDLDTLDLIEGETYNFDFFWAERHTTGSNFTITTSIVFEDKLNPQTPFSCEASGTVVSYVTSGSASKGDSNLALISIADGEILSNTVLPEPTEGVNSIGYNVKDDYIWGYNIPSRKIVRIGSDNSINYYEMDHIPDINGHYYNAADVSPNGVLFLKSDTVKNRLDRVKLDGTKKTQHVLNSINLDQELNTDDFAFNPKDGKIYYIDYDDGWFKRIDISGNNGYIKKVKHVGEAWTIIAAFDVDGNFYYNSGENINKLSIEYNGNQMKADSITVIKNFSQIDGVSQGDGARCANAKVVPPSSSLVSEYRMDACSWNGTENEVKDENGTYPATAKNGLKTTRDGKIGRAGSFDGIGYIDTGDSFNEVFGTSSNQFTITAWIKPTDLSDSQTNHKTKNTFFAKASDAKNDNIEIGVNPDGSLHLYLDTKKRDKFADIGGGITPDAWHFVAVAYKDGIVKVNIDGTLYEDSTTWKGATIIDSAEGSPLIIGGSLHVDNFFQGQIDEVKIYKEALTDAEMEARYNSEKDDDGSQRVKQTCIISEYRFDACEWFEPSGKVKDSIEGNDLSVKAVYPSDDAILQKAALFEEKESLIDGDIHYSFTNKPFTMAFWMKLDKLPTKAYMAVLGKDFELYVGRDGKVYLNPKDGTSDDIVSSSTVQKDTWYYITVIGDGKELTLYIDGNENGHKEVNDLGKDGSSQLMLGSTSWNTNDNPKVENFSGKIDELKIFDNALEVSKIEELIAFDNSGKNMDGSTRQEVICLTPIGCTSKAIVIDDTKYVHQIDLVTGDKNTTVMNEAQINDAKINGFGYNVKDGYIWGSFNPGKGGYLVKVGKDESGEFAQKKVGPIEGLPTNKGTYIGDIDNNGMLYLYYKNTPSNRIYTMYIIDLNKESSNYLKVVDSFTLDNLIIADMAFNPIDKQLYAIDYYRRLYKIDVNNHTVYLLKTDAVDGADEFFGSSFFDAQGFFYAIKNSSRGVYRIDISDPQKIRSLLFSTLANENVQNVNIDGGRCNLKPIYIDYGDAPDGSSYSIGDGTDVLNYRTLTSDNGPRHRLPSDENETNVYLGNGVSSESDAKSSTADYNYDDDDGIIGGIKPLYTNMYKYSLDVRVHNDTNKTANLVGWIDFNRNGRFESSEGVSLQIVPNSQGDYTLNWSVPNDIAVGKTYARFRVTTDPLTDDEADSYGPKGDGEVEDWEITIKEGSLYDVWDTDSDTTGRVIKTKIAKQPFALNIASVNRAGNLKESTGSDIKVRIVSKEDGKVLSDYQDVNLSGVMQKVLNFGELNATREAQVQIRFTDEQNITREINATDTFAIRPDRFEIQAVGDSFTAGKDFNLTLLVKDVHGNRTETFMQDAERYFLDVNETKRVSACSDLNVTVQKKEKRDFVHGEANVTIQYPDVGNLKFKIYEKVGSEYAIVDSDDTPDIQRLISPDEKIHGLNPKSISLEWQMENGDQINDVTYFNSYNANDPDYNTMYAQLNLKVTIKNALNQPVKKFTDDCYAEDIDLGFKYSVESNDTNPYLIRSSYEDQNGTLRTGLSRLPDMINVGDASYDGLKIEKSLFENGVGVKTIKFNLNRNASVPRNPVRLKIKDLNATLDTLSDTDTADKNVMFYYVRAHIPDQEVVGKEMDAKVYYEVYCKDCDMSAFGLSGLSESVDSIYWYQLDSVNETYFSFKDPAVTNSMHMTLPGGISAVTNIFTGLEKRNGGKILHAAVSKAPQKVRIKYEPKRYLVYNPFKPTARLHSFTANFSPANKSWAGKGDLGFTVDTNIAPRNNIDIIDW